MAAPRAAGDAPPTRATLQPQCRARRDGPGAVAAARSLAGTFAPPSERTSDGAGPRLASTQRVAAPEPFPVRRDRERRFAGPGEPVGLPPGRSCPSVPRHRRLAAPPRPRTRRLPAGRRPRRRRGVRSEPQRGLTCGGRHSTPGSGVAHSPAAEAGASFSRGTAAAQQHTGAAGARSKRGEHLRCSSGTQWLGPVATISTLGTRTCSKHSTGAGARALARSDRWLKTRGEHLRCSSGTQ